MKMLTFWVVLLLCSLLPTSQSTMGSTYSSVVRMNKVVLEKVVAQSMAERNVMQGLVGQTLCGSESVGNPAGKIVPRHQGGLLGGGLLGSNKGLLGGLLGADKGLLGLKIVDITLPQVSLKLLKPVGLGLSIYTKVGLNADSLLGGLLNLQVEANITGSARLVLSNEQLPGFVTESCQVRAKIISGLLPGLGNTLTTLLSNLLPGVLCPVVQFVLNVLNTLLATLNTVVPFGTLGSLHYTLANTPLFKDQEIILNLNLAVVSPEGNTVELGPMQPPVLPPLQPGDQASQLAFSQDLLSSVLQLYVTKGSFNAQLTGQTGTVPMTTSALLSVLAQGSPLSQANLPLVVTLQSNDIPAMSLHSGEFTLTLAALLGVSARTTGGLTPLFEVDAINLINNWITSLFQVEYLPMINGIVGAGIPLPNAFNMEYVSAVSSAENAVVVNMMPKMM